VLADGSGGGRRRQPDEFGCGGKCKQNACGIYRHLQPEAREFRGTKMFSASTMFPGNALL
jgi:hypothetical protein